MKYLNEKGIIIKEILNEEAEKLVNSFACIENNSHSIFKCSDDKKRPLTMTQLRRYYNDAKALERKWILAKTKANSSEQKVEEFEKILPHIYMFRAKAISADKKAPACFINWLGDVAVSVKTFQDFEAFLLHFEAVVGFAKAKLPR